MRVKIKRFDRSLPLPKYQTSGAAAFDLYARSQVTIAPHQVEKVPLNIALQLPKDYWALLAARSSLHKKGLIMANAIGIGDYDYRGDEDEYHAALYNLTGKPVTIKKGERIVQMIILQREQVKFDEAEEFRTKSRGGFGSTGK